MTEDEMVGWHRQLDGHGFGWTPGVGDGQGSLAYCNSWGRKESDTTERLNWTELKWLSCKEPACQCRRHRFDPWIWKTPWRRKWQPTPVFLPGESQGQSSLADYSPWSHKESDTNERLSMNTARKSTWKVPPPPQLLILRNNSSIYGARISHQHTSFKLYRFQYKRVVSSSFKTQNTHSCRE